MEDLTWISCGSHAEAATSAAIGKMSHLGTDFDRVSAPVFNRYFQEASTSFLGWAGEPIPDSEELRQAVELLKSDPDLKIVLLFPASIEEAIRALAIISRSLGSSAQKPGTADCGSGLQTGSGSTTGFPGCLPAALGNDFSSLGKSRRHLG